MAIAPRLTVAALVSSALLAAGCGGEESAPDEPRMTAAETGRHLTARTDPRQNVVCEPGVGVDSDSVPRYSG